MSRYVCLAAVLVLAPLSLAVLSGYGQGTAPPAASQDDPFAPDPRDAAKPAPKASTAPADEDPFAEPPPKPAEKPKDPPHADREKPLPKPLATPVRPRTPPAGPLAVGEQAVLKALEAPASIDSVERPLAEVLEDLAQKHLIALHVDKKALDDVGIGTDTPVTFGMGGVPLRTALELLLRQFGLTWTVKSGVLLITTPEEAESILFAKTYDVADLLISTNDSPFLRGVLPTAVPRDAMGLPYTSSSFIGGGLGGGSSGKATGGMGGMGMGMGGGFFNIGPSASPPVPGAYSPQDSMDALVNLVTTAAAPTTWDSVGGPGSCQPYQRTLVIRQTLAVHREVEDVLADLRSKRQAVPTLAVELRWLWLDAKQVETLAPGDKVLPSGRTALAVDPKVLAQLSGEAPGLRGRIACQSGQLVHLASGDRRSAITSAIPVIGSGVGYQPVVEVPNVGVVVELRPSVTAGGESALLDVRSSVTRWGKQEPPVRVGAEWPRGEVQKGESEPEQWPAGSASVAVDRPNMPAQEWAATVRVSLGQPVLLAGVSFAPADEALPAAGAKAAESKQLCLIATVSVVEAQGK